MKRYFVKPDFQPVRLAHIHDEVDAENYLARTVYEPDYAPFETGVLDAEGRMIMAHFEMAPIGFTTEFVRTDE